MSSDPILACFLPLIVLFIAYRLFPSFKLADLRDLLFPSQQRTERGQFSTQNAFSSYRRYRQLCAVELSRMRTSYSSIGRTHKRIGYDIGYPAKLNTLHEITQSNARITDAIARLAADEFDVGDSPIGNVGPSDLARVREALKHFVRDWSTEGAHERDIIFTPILEVLRQVPHDQRAGRKVLIPGSGLGRLAWEVSELGFDTTANELSFFMNLAFRFLLSPETTSSINQHTVHPYGYWFSHQRSNASLFRPIQFPDVLPRLQGDQLRILEGDFFSLFKERESYDYVITLFFIDTSQNVLATLEHIHGLLRKGGMWINLGPLLWTSGGQAKLELSLDELLSSAKALGFTFMDEQELEDDHTPDCMRQRTVPCEYTSDQNAMMQWVYKAEFWVARKH